MNFATTWLKHGSLHVCITYIIIKTRSIWNRVVQVDVFEISYTFVFNYDGCDQRFCDESVGILYCVCSCYSKHIYSKCHLILFSFCWFLWPVYQIRDTKILFEAPFWCSAKCFTCHILVKIVSPLRCLIEKWNIPFF